MVRYDILCVPSFRVPAAEVGSRPFIFSAQQVPHSYYSHVYCGWIFGNLLRVVEHREREREIDIKTKETD